MKKIVLVLLVALSLISFPAKVNTVYAEKDDSLITRGAYIPFSKTFEASPRTDVSITVSGSYERVNGVVTNYTANAYASNSLATISSVNIFSNGANITVYVYYYVFGYSGLKSQHFDF